ncbi:MAG: twin-arginine translocase TatA/TatE family subunit [Desulforhopalus sp.]|nr:twin-arginine translocase TatA/TatE family subunit [Desulforhopalus sp.]
MFGMGIWELLVILAIVVVIFGAGKLPELGAGLGKGIKNFKDATKKEEQKTIDDEKNEKSE